MPAAPVEPVRGPNSNVRGHRDRAGPGDDRSSRNGRGRDVPPVSATAPARRPAGRPERDHTPLLTRADWLAAAAFVVLAALLRLPRLGETPAWDGDEGYNLDIAWHLWHGQAQFFALDYAFVQHPVLYYAALAPLLGLSGPALWVARLVAAMAGALSAGALYLAGAIATGRRVAALAALCLAATHFAVLYTRFAYTYGLLVLWTALALLFVLAWQRTQLPWLWWAATAAAALGLLTDQEGIYLPLFVAASAWPQRRRAAVTLGAALAPAACFALAMLVARSEAALTDWSYSFLRLQGAAGGPTGPTVAAARWLVNYLHLLRAEWWLPLGVTGLFCIRPLPVRRRVLLLAGLMALPIFALRELEPFFRTGLPLLVPLSWGAGALLDRGMDAVFATFAPDRRVDPSSRTDNGKVERRKTKEESPPTRFVFRPPSFVLSDRVRWRALLTAALFLGLPLGLEAGRSAGAIWAGFTTRFDWALTVDEQDARAAAAYVNANTTADDVVVVSPAVAWLYHARATDFFQAIARRGDAIAFYPAHLPVRRFRFDPSPNAVRFAVVDPYWDLWAGQSGLVKDLVGEVERWPVVWQRGQTRVFRQP